MSEPITCRSEGQLVWTSFVSCIALNELIAYSTPQHTKFIQLARQMSTEAEQKCLHKCFTKNTFSLALAEFCVYICSWIMCFLKLNYYDRGK